MPLLHHLQVFWVFWSKVSSRFKQGHPVLKAPKVTNLKVINKRYAGGLSGKVNLSEYLQNLNRILVLNLCSRIAEVLVLICVFPLIEFIYSEIFVTSVNKLLCCLFYLHTSSATFLESFNLFYLIISSETHHKFTHNTTNGPLCKTPTYKWNASNLATLPKTCLNRYWTKQWLCTWYSCISRKC